MRDSAINNANEKLEGARAVQDAVAMSSDASAFLLNVKEALAGGGSGGESPDDDNDALIAGDDGA